MKFNLDFIYPIGSIYINTNEINPSMIFGGTWERIQGRYLMGAGTPSQNTYNEFGMLTDNDLQRNFQPATFGEYTHKLSTEEMPSHNHAFWQNPTAGHGAGSYGGLAYVMQASLTTDGRYGNVSMTGNGNAHNNLPPTIVVYMWKRIA